jgi:hypothetical protein
VRTSESEVATPSPSVPRPKPPSGATAPAAPLAKPEPPAATLPTADIARRAEESATLQEAAVPTPAGSDAPRATQPASGSALATQPPSDEPPGTTAPASPRAEPDAPASTGSAAAGEDRGSGLDPDRDASGTAAAQAPSAPRATPIEPGRAPDDGLGGQQALESPDRERTRVGTPASGPAQAPPSPAIVRILARLESLLRVPPYLTRRDLTVEGLRLSDVELYNRRTSALEARADILRLLEALRGDVRQWTEVRAALGADGTQRVETALRVTFGDGRAADELERALRLWRGETSVAR